MMNRYNIAGRMNFGGYVVDWHIDDAGTVCIPTPNKSPMQALALVENMNNRLEQLNIVTANQPAVTATAAPRTEAVTHTPPPRLEAATTTTDRPMAPAKRRGRPPKEGGPVKRRNRKAKSPAVAS